MKKPLALIAAFAAALSAPHAMADLGAADLSFTAFNADEDGFAMVALADIAANTKVWFTDNEWNGSAFNTGESYSSWVSGASVISLPTGQGWPSTAAGSRSRFRSASAMNIALSTRQWLITASGLISGALTALLLH